MGESEATLLTRRPPRISPDARVNAVVKRMLKKLELAWKAVWLKFFVGVVRITHRPSPEPDWARDPVRVLFLRPDRIGDAIVTSGLLREIAARNPSLTLDVLGTPRNEGILRTLPGVTHFHLFDRRRRSTWPGLIRGLRATRYDAVIDCMVTAPSMTTMLLMLATGARHRIGIAGRGIDGALTVRVPANAGATHIIEHLAAFGGVFGLDPGEADWRPGLHVPEDDRFRALNAWMGAGPERKGVVAPCRVLINVSAGKPARNWPEAAFAAAVARIREHAGAMECLVIGAPAERDRAERVAALAGARAFATPRLADMVALVSTADFLLTPDTSVAHVASATRTPAVVLYLAGTSRLWGLYGTPGTSLEAPGKTLVDYPVEPVLAAIDSVFDHMLPRDDSSVAAV